MMTTAILNPPYEVKNDCEKLFTQVDDDMQKCAKVRYYSVVTHPFIHTIEHDERKWAATHHYRAQE